MKPCPKCRRALADIATACFCGWVEPSTRPAPAPQLEPVNEFVTPVQRERVQGLMRKLKTLGTQPWTRERRIAKWKEVLANPNAGIHAHNLAREAIYLLTLPPAAQREPGEDDEPEPA